MMCWKKKEIYRFLHIRFGLKSALNPKKFALMDIYSTYIHVYTYLINVCLHFCVKQVCLGVCKEMLMMFEIQKANIVKKGCI